MLISGTLPASVISPEFRKRFLSNPDDPMAFEGPALCFEGPEHYHHAIEESPTRCTDKTVLIMRGSGPLGYPGAAEVVNMQPPGELIKRGIQELPCIGDGRQSGTSGSPSILHASPEAALNGNIAYVQDGDIIRVDLLKRKVDIMISTEELERRKTEKGAYKQPESQTPWQEMFRADVDQLSEGMVMKSAVKYQRIAANFGVPRDNH